MITTDGGGLRLADAARRDDDSGSHLLSGREHLLCSSRPADSRLRGHRRRGRWPDTAHPSPHPRHRNGTGSISGPVASGHSISLNVLGVGGVPASGVSAVVLNVTATPPSANGYLTVYPDGASRPTTSNLNFSAGETVPNLVIAPVGSDGKVDFYNGSGGTVQVVADVSGWFASGSRRGRWPDTAHPSPHPRHPQRHRGHQRPGGVGSLDQSERRGRRWRPRLRCERRRAQRDGHRAQRERIPDRLSRRCDRPTTSNLNFSAGETVPNLVIAPVGSDGKVDFYNGSGGTVQVIADVSGWFASGTAAAGGLTPLTPARILDTPATAPGASAARWRRSTRSA